MEDDCDVTELLLTPDDRHKYTPLECLLWRAVIRQALVDSTWPLQSRLGDDASIVKQDALNFFIWETCVATVRMNFETVCEYAGISPFALRSTALRYITQGIPFKGAF